MRAMMAGGTLAPRYADEGALRGRACGARYTEPVLPLAPANALRAGHDQDPSAGGSLAWAFDL